MAQGLAVIAVIDPPWLDARRQWVRATASAADA
jgi:hypothetical protein